MTDKDFETLRRIGEMSQVGGLVEGSSLTVCIAASGIAIHGHVIRGVNGNRKHAEVVQMVSWRDFERWGWDTVESLTKATKARMAEVEAQMIEAEGQD